MDKIEKFTNDGGMWDGFAGCSSWPKIEGKENDGYQQPIYAHTSNSDKEKVWLVIGDAECVQAYGPEETDGKVMNLTKKFSTQVEAIRFLEIINPLTERDFVLLGFEEIC